MQNTRRITNRLPEFMTAYKDDTLLYSIVESIGKTLEQAEDKIAEIMLSKWFPVASISDLDRIGSLFGVDRLTGEDLPSFKTRLYATIQELLKGVGTIDSIRALVTAAMGFEPEIIENPKTTRHGGPERIKAGEKWVEDCRSALDPTPTIIFEGQIPIRNPTIANLTNGESITYNGLLRSGAFLTILPDGKASLAGIDVTDRITTSHNRVPKLSRPKSEWVYQDMNAFFDQGKFGSATFAGSQRFTIKIELSWDESKPASFIVKLPLYSNKFHPTEEITTHDMEASIGYEQELRQEVRNLVENVKTAGIEGEINFWDDFSEKNVMKDEIHPQLNTVTKDKVKHEEDFELIGEATFSELHEIKDDFYIAGSFDITSFNSGNRFG